jgi:hypothetical protein
MKTMLTVGTFLLSTLLMSTHAHASDTEYPFVTELKNELARHPDVAECAGSYSSYPNPFFNNVSLTCIDSDGKKIIKLFYGHDRGSLFYGNGGDSDDIWLATQMLLRKAKLTVTVTSINKKDVQKLSAHLANSQNVCEHVDEKEAICHKHRYLRAD